MTTASVFRIHHDSSRAVTSSVSQRPPSQTIKKLDKSDDSVIVTTQQYPSYPPPESAPIFDVAKHRNSNSSSHQRQRNSIMTFFDGFTNKKKNEEEMEEMQERRSTVKVASPSQHCEVVGGYDICNEYSYEEDEDDEMEENNNNNTNNNNNNNSSSGSGTLSLFTPISTKKATTALTQQQQQQHTHTYVLGKVYHPIHDFATRRDDEATLFWFTYRCDFVEIVPYNITSDAGWGCMLRSAQMMLGQALRLHYKSRNWKPIHPLARRRQDPFVRSILTWFADFPSTAECVYSLHNMVAAGLKYDKLPGEWYGPGTACYVLRDLVQLHEKNQKYHCHDKKKDKCIFRVHVAAHGALYRDVVHDLMTHENKKHYEYEKIVKEKEHDPPTHPLDIMDWEDELIENSYQISWDTSLLLLIPLRLGLKCFHEDYKDVLSFTFMLSQSVGVLGGKPRGARWFYGAEANGTKIYGLDPHTVQNAPRRKRTNNSSTTNTTRSKHTNAAATATSTTTATTSVVELSEEYMRSCHTTYPEAFQMSKMDPSIALGFYCRNREDFEQLLSSLQTWQKEHPKSPELCTFADYAPNYMSCDDGGDDGGNFISSSSLMNNMMMDGSLLAIDDGQISDEDEYVVL